MGEFFCGRRRKIGVVTLVGRAYLLMSIFRLTKFLLRENPMHWIIPPLLMMLVPPVADAAHPMQGAIVFPKDDVSALRWSSYLFVMSCFVILPMVIGLAGLFMCVRSRRRRRLGAALLFGLAIASIPALFLYGIPILVLLQPTPTQAATVVDNILGVQPSDVISMDIVPYTRPKVGMFPFGYVTFDQASEITKICDALHSAQPNHCDYGKGTVPFYHSDPEWQSYFILQTKNAKHACYVTKLKSDSTLIDIFYDMGLRSRTYLGTYKSEQLAIVLESLAELRK